MRKKTDHRPVRPLGRRAGADFVITARLLNEMAGWMPGMQFKVQTDIDPERLHCTWWRRDQALTWTLRKEDFQRVDELEALAMKECRAMYQALREEMP